MKVYVNAYLKYNLGDDLFVKILSDRYKNTIFYSYSDYDYKNVFKSNNLKIYGGSLYKIINKVIKAITLKKCKLSNFLIKRHEFTIFIGGSMFIQNTNKVEKSILEEAKGYYILGSNFGPYNNIEYYNYYKNIFKKASDVCFRDQNSYEKFKELKNVRWASDIVFTLDTSNIKIKDNKKIIISVIDCSRKNNCEYRDIYEKKIIEISEYFIRNGYEVVMMSFCKFEGDEQAIESIYSKCNEKIKQKIRKYYYRGNIEEALNVIADCQIVVGTRFHANILGLLLGKEIIPIAYSEKTINVLKDINFKGKIIKLKEIDKLNVDNLLENYDLKYKNKDISFQIKNAERQFVKVDEILKKEVKNGRIKN